MSKNNEYNDGWQDGFWAGSGSAYSRGYEEGVQAEHNRVKHTIDGGLSADEMSTLGSMVGGSIILTLLGWCFIGLIIFLLWVGGESGSWWFPWIWRVAFWSGIGFVILMSILGVIMAIIEHRETKNPSEKPIDNSNMPWYKKYPPADVIKKQKK